ncbi:hypothetical protein FXO38_32133 [Capsicum annuum]|nr:hypothetical protein FXO38_32133 [Capsicum annuum]
MDFRKINEVSCKKSTTATSTEIKLVGPINRRNLNACALDGSQYFTILEMTKRRKSQILAVTTTLGGNFTFILLDEPSETGCNFGEFENLMNSLTSMKVNTFMVDAIDLDEKFPMMEQTIEALKKSVDEKDHQIARLMSKLDLYNPGESNYNLTPREKFNGESLIKTTDNYCDDQSASVATLTVQKLQDMIANTIKEQYGSPLQSFIGYSKLYSK